jgi:hypothetical protein
MAGYLPPLDRPSVELLQRGFVDQTESAKFCSHTLNLIANSGFDQRTFVLNCIAHLYERNGVSELTEFMSYVRSSLGIIDNTKTQTKTYEFVKGVPAISEGKIGYTFGRRGGLFFFLIKQGGTNVSD